jgi:hypothetical protein
MSANATNPTRYTCVGEVRGRCWVWHRSEAAAKRCISRDNAACKKQGIQGDREVHDVATLAAADAAGYELDELTIAIIDAAVVRVGMGNDYTITHADAAVLAIVADVDVEAVVSAAHEAGVAIV